MSQQVPVLDFGYDAENTMASGVFAGVESDSNAYRAGLRDGMKRLAILGGDPGDSSVPFRFRVRDDADRHYLFAAGQGPLHPPAYYHPGWAESGRPGGLPVRRRRVLTASALRQTRTA